MMNKYVLDACCGSKMFWFDKGNPNVIFMDNRSLDTILSDGRRLAIQPDLVADFRNIPFEDDTFYTVVFDPPHLIRAGSKSWLSQKYGTLDPINWKRDLSKGFSECMRVLKPHGNLIFKWNTDQIPMNDVLKLFDSTPIFGDQRSKTRWLVFMKE